MKTTRIKRIVTEKECECEVRFYVWAQPFNDPHYRPDPPYIEGNKYFDTREEAENFKKELDKVGAWVKYSVREEIVKWLE